MNDPGPIQQARRQLEGLDGNQLAGLFPLVHGYVAAQLDRGVYAAMPKVIFPADPYDAGQLRGWVVELFRHHRVELESYLRNRPSDRSPEMSRIVDHIRQTVTEAERSASKNAYELRTHLTDLPYRIRKLLENPPTKPFGHEDAKALALAQWFKSSFMTWVDPIKCPTCHGPTTAAGAVEPKWREISDSAGRCELHVCDDAACGGQRRFARYTSSETLMTTREGRCGEWAQLFYVFMIAAGLDARYVWNSEDHVWNEYWSPTLKHWVHVDSCEGVTNKPLLYARGWGKKQAFCLAVGKHGAEDVTRVYVDDWPECQNRRRRWNSRRLSRLLLKDTVSRRLNMPDAEHTRVRMMDDLQALWVSDEAGRLAEADRDGELGGRTSGPEDWRSRRQELGGDIVTRPHFTVVRDMNGSAESSPRLLGTASLDHALGAVRLTSGPSHTGGIFHASPVAQSKSFRCELAFRITAPPDCGEADGMALVFCRRPELGLGGYGMGYSGLGGQGDFAVEIDTYRTRDHADDPPTPHISVHSPPIAHHRHALATTPPGRLPWLSDGWTYRLEIFYNGSSRRLSGYLAYNIDERGPAGQHSPRNISRARRPTHQGVEDSERQMHLFDVVIPTSEDEHDWVVGVTAACGGLWQIHDVLEFTIEQIAFST